MRPRWKQAAFRWSTAIAFLAVPSCSSKAPAHLPQGTLMSDRISFNFAVYYLSPPKGDPIADLDRLLAAEFPGLKRNASPRTVSARLVTDVQTSYAPPDLESLSYRSEGLAAEQGQALQHSPAALVLSFSHGKEHLWDGLRGAMELAGRIARDSGGLVWDEAGRKVMAPEEWGRRLDAWPAGTVPDCRDLIWIDLYKDGEYGRAVTLGMKKLGLPDLVAEELPSSITRGTGNLINALAQALAEGAALKKAGEIELSLRSIENPDVRESSLAQVGGQGRGEARLALTWADPKEGDPDNRLIQIGFGRYPGNDLHAQQEALIVDFWGAQKDAISYIKHNDEIQAASRKAREKLPALHAAFNAGFAPDESLLVKAPFATPAGGKEWMWVEVTSWKGDAIRGTLQNEPSEIPDLQAGQEVEVSEKEVFDYLRKFPDGRREGNTTAVAIEALEKSQGSPDSE